MIFTLAQSGSVEAEVVGSLDKRFLIIHSDFDLLLEFWDKLIWI